MAPVLPIHYAKGVLEDPLCRLLSEQEDDGFLKSSAPELVTCQECLRRLRIDETAP